MAQTAAEARTGPPQGKAPTASTLPLDILLIDLGRLTPVFRAGLQGASGTVDDAEGFDAASSRARSVQPDLILVGGRCGEDPSDLVEELRAVAPAALLLYLAPSSDPVPALRAVASGADDVVIPPHTLASVILRVRLLQGRNGRRRPLPVGLDEGPAVAVDRVSHMVSTGDQPTRLTGREFELLDRLLEDEGQPVPRGRLLTDIWGEAQSSEAVLDATVHRLRRKIEDNPARPRVLLTVRGVGYRLEVGGVRVASS